jgi:hypothetical protein
MEYTDLKIIDCNRQHSIQVKSGNSENNALFTNEVGAIELDVGDKVSVQGAYISEIGAGSDTIELKGINLGKTRTINFINEDRDYPTSVRDLDQDPSLEDSVLATPLITGYQRLRSYVDTFTYDLKDNETYISNQYYLNLSGDSGYVLLPRRFAYPTTIPNDNTMWNNADSFATGRCHNQIEGQFASCDYDFVYGGNMDEEWNKATGIYKISNDNTRLTLMRRVEDGYMDLRPYLNVGDGYGGEGTIPSPDEPSRKIYAIYQDYFKVSVDKGFTSPENLAMEITKQFKTAGNPQVFQVVDHDDNIRDLSVIYSTNTYKPFLCGSVDTFKEDNLTEYLKAVGTEGKDKQKSQNYYSNYYNIYCKRPELRIAGQKLNSHIGLATTFGAISYLDKKSPIVIELDFNDNNLLRLKEFFSVQALYPELFDNDNFKKLNPTNLGVVYDVNNVRFLHMNTEVRGAGPYYHLGGDNMDETTNTTPSKQSCPLFIYFDKNNAEKKTDGNNTDDLCYGFASRDSSNNYIVLHPDKLSLGINARLFGPDENIDIGSGTILGYDYSFNAYGSVCACGLNGRSTMDYGGVNKWGVLTEGVDEADAVNNFSGTLRYNYVGAINPIFKYENEHFNIEGLHTPEVGGQASVYAGDNGPDQAIPDNTAQGGFSVYKINKRINGYVYTPDMRPYDLTKTGNYTNFGGNNQERILTIKNRNIKSWSIFDSICGVYFTDLGYDKEDFQSGLFGILGFRHQQVSGVITADNNRNTRIIQDDNNGLLTTNSQVATSDTRDYIVNQFGAVFFTNQIPTSSVLVFQTGSHTKADIEPAISQSSDSFKVVATDLPRKMINPYYTIRSDIIDSNHYVGGEDSKTILPVVAVCDKQYSGGDFVFGAENEFTFTITKKKVITTITTAITDPNQSFARVDDESAVIYKIMKTRRAEQDLVSQYLKSLEKKK